MKMYILSLALFTAALTLGAVPASAITIDFELLQHVDASTGSHGDVYSEEGFTLSTPPGAHGFGSWGTGFEAFTGSTALFNNSVDGVTELTRDGGGSFSLVSIDLAEFLGDGVREVSFIGFVSGGGTIVQTFTLDGVAFGAETFNFPLFVGFDNLTKVSWSQDNPFHQFDNIVVSGNNENAVPEPASLGLLGLGLAGLAWIRRGARQ